MKNNMVILSLVLVLALMASVGVAGASELMRIHVPFDFYAGNQQVPAGDYTFSMESSLSATGSRVKINSKDGEGICLLLTQPGQDESTSRLLFNKYGNKYFLTSVSIRGFKAALKATKLEQELRVQLQTPQNVVLVAQR
jgi:hypothetical protein